MKDIGDYIVYSDGKVWIKYWKRFIKPCKLKNGYLQIGLNKHKMYLHRLIAQTFIPNPDNLPEVDHKDSNKENCSVENLQWCTRKFNMQKAWAEGRMSNVTSYNSKLTKDEVYDIRYKLNHLKNVEVSRMFKNASENTVSLIRNNKSWKEI